MTNFLHLDLSTPRPGVSRHHSTIGTARQLRSGLTGARGLSRLLLSAMAAAVMVVAYQVMDNVAQGHLLVLWTTMWAIAFAVLGLFAGTARRAALSLKSGLDSWARATAEARADERLWKMASADSRVMADLQAAATRAESMSSEPEQITRDTKAAKVKQRYEGAASS